MGVTGMLLSIAFCLPQATALEHSPTRLPELREIDAVEILEHVRRARARAVLVNVWATWCAPCRKEIPDLLRLRDELQDQGLQLVLVSADFPSDVDAVRTFLAGYGVDFTTYLRVGDDTEFVEWLERRWSGGLPASFVYDDRGRLRHFWEGTAGYEQFRKKVLDVIGTVPGPSGPPLEPPATTTENP